MVLIRNYFEDYFQKSSNIKLLDCFEKNKLIIFPKSYKNLVADVDGGWLKRNIFSYKNKKNNIIEDVVGCFLCWGNSPYESFSELVKSPPEFFSEGLIAFASNGGGDYLCFDYRNCRENPPIVLWLSRGRRERGVVFLSSSFDEFINNLKSEEEVGLDRV